MKKMSFDPTRDRQEVEQFGFVDLRTAFDRGILPGNIGFNDDSFNGVNNPSLLLPHAQDVFDSVRQASAVSASLSYARSKEAAKLAEQVKEKVTVTE